MAKISARGATETARYVYTSADSAATITVIVRSDGGVLTQTKIDGHSYGKTHWKGAEAAIKKNGFETWEAAAIELGYVKVTK